MTPQALLDQIVEIVPEFHGAWDKPNNYSRRDDGTFTLHGVFCELTSFYKDRGSSLSNDVLMRIADFVNKCMESGDEDLDNAAATCFVENIAGEDCARPIAPYFKGHALSYFEEWGGLPIEDLALRAFLQRHRQVP